MKVSAIGVTFAAHLACVELTTRAKLTLISDGVARAVRLALKEE